MVMLGWVAAAAATILAIAGWLRAHALSRRCVALRATMEAQRRAREAALLQPTIPREMLARRLTGVLPRFRLPDDDPPYN